MLCKWLLVVNICVGATKVSICYLIANRIHLWTQMSVSCESRTFMVILMLIWRAHMYIAVEVSVVIGRFAILSILPFIIWNKLWSKGFNTSLKGIKLRATIWRIFCSETTLCHIKVLVLQLFDTSLQCPVFIAELNKLCVHFVNSCCFWLDIFDMTTSSEFPILCITFLHDALDLGRHQFVIVLAIILKDTFNKLQALSQRLVLNIQLEALSVLVF